MRVVTVVIVVKEVAFVKLVTVVTVVTVATVVTQIYGKIFCDRDKKSANKFKYKKYVTKQFRQKRKKILN